ncbi:hypothetical protein CL653_03235 [bacterium]|nr:hypothetical protein [bacterium]|tara:strand:+ start:421 stop:651 length:231 start_codon:yes stop_codon:yes gene_type:complete
MKTVSKEVYERFERHGVNQDVLNKSLKNGDRLIDVGHSRLVIDTVMNGATPHYDDRGNYIGSHYCPFIPKGIDNKT